MVECHARLAGATDDEWRTHLEASMAECEQKIRDYLQTAERSEWEERLAFETETIKRALRHDLILFGAVGSASELVFTWRAASGMIGRRFDDRALAIDWMAAWLVDGVGEQDTRTAASVPESAPMGNEGLP